MATLSGSLGTLLTNQFALGATAAGQPYTNIAPVMTVTEQAKLFHLHGYTTSTLQSTCLRRAGASSGYQVPAGKKLLILGITYGRTAAGGIVNFDQIGIQGMDTDTGFPTNTSAVNPDLRGDPGNLGQINTSDNKYGFFPYFYVIRANKFVHFFTNTGQYMVNAACLLVDASDGTFTGATYTIGGQTFTNLGRLKTLVWGSNSSGPVATPREAGVLSGYTPPAGKVFHALASYITARSVSAGDLWTMETGSTDVGLFSSTATGTPDDNGNGAILGGGIIAAEVVYRKHHLVVPSGRYLYCSGGNGRLDGTIYGYEVDAAATTF